MNNIDKKYTDLLQDILDNGVKKETRNGGTISVFGRQIRHKMSEGFPLLTTKKMHWKSIVTELLWFLRGDTNIKYLVDNDCHIWDGDAYKRYKTTNPDRLANDEMFETRDKPTKTYRFFTQEEFINKIKTDNEFAKKWGDLGKIYGAQWRSWKHMGPKSQQEMLDENTNWPWKTTEIDQIANLINDLKTNPDSRRLMVTAWNPADLPHQVLPPCHYGFQVYTRELSLEERENLMDKIYGLTKETRIVPWNILDINKANIPTRAISLMYNCRSQDVPLGTPFNISSYALLLMMIAKQVNMVPDQLIGNLGDCHIYLNQIDAVKEQLNREPYPLPTVEILNAQVDDIAHYEISDFELINYQSHPTIKMPLSN